MPVVSVLDSVVPAELTAAELLLAEEHERQALSAGLHDGPVQGVIAMRFLSDLAASALRKGDVATASARLEELAVATREAQADLRRTMRAQHGRCLDGTGLADAVEAHAVAVHSEGGPLTRVDIDWPSPLPPVVAVALHRVAQAALVDAKARRAESATVSVEPREDGIHLTVVDGGLTPSAALSPESSSLARWVVRIGHLGGRLELTTNPGQHQVSCWLPLDPSAFGGPQP